MAVCGVLVGTFLLQANLALAQGTTADELTSQGAALLREEQLEDALDRFRGALDARPSDPALEFNVGLALFRLEQSEESLGPLERAVAHPPSASNARFFRGIA